MGRSRNKDIVAESELAVTPNEGEFSQRKNEKISGYYSDFGLSRKSRRLGQEVRERVFAFRKKLSPILSKNEWRG